jgi:hypothetical protein
VKTDESQHPAPTPEEGTALIYFVADGHLSSVFGFDEKWEGAVDGGRYFFVPVEPGEHHICAMLQSFMTRRVLTGLPRVSVHLLKAEPGGTYYFRARLVGISTGFVLQRGHLETLELPRSEDQLQYASAVSRSATSNQQFGRVEPDMMMNSELDKPITWKRLWGVFGIIRVLEAPLRAA